MIHCGRYVFIQQITVVKHIRQFFNDKYLVLAFFEIGSVGHKLVAWNSSDCFESFSPLNNWGSLYERRNRNSFATHFELQSRENHKRTTKVARIVETTKGKDEVIRNFASRVEKTTLKNDYVVIFFCGSRNRRLASDKNLSFFGGSKHEKCN